MFSKSKIFVLFCFMLCISGCTSEYLLAGAYSGWVDRYGNDKSPLRYWGYVDAQGERARFENIIAIGVDRQENVYVADSGNHRIRKIDPQGRVSTFIGSDQEQVTFGHEKPLETQIDSLSGMTIFKDVLYFSVAGCIRYIDLKQEDALVQTYYGKCLSPGETALPFSDEIAPAKQYLPVLQGLTHDAQGNLYVKASSMFQEKQRETKYSPSSVVLYKIDPEKNISVENHGGMGERYVVADSTGCVAGLYDSNTGDASFIRKYTIDSPCRKKPSKSGFFFENRDEPVDSRLEPEAIFAIGMGKSDDLYIFGKWLATLNIHGDLRFIAPLDGFEGTLVTLNDDESIIYSARETAVYRWPIHGRESPR